MATVGSMESTTMNTYLFMEGTTAGTYDKLVSIKDFPDLGGAPDQVEITDLDDASQRFLLGVQSMSNMEFTANYMLDKYKTIKALCDGTIRNFAIKFGENAEYGEFRWSGQIAVYVTGGGVNAAREMKISISPSTSIDLYEAPQG